MLNFFLADLISRIHVASCKFMYSVNVLYSISNLRILIVLNYEGFIEGFRVLKDIIIVFLKYNYLNNCMLFKNTKLISTPGRRVYLNLIKLNKTYSYRNFSGVFLLSSNRGIITSTDALLKLRSSGEIFLKLTI
jgi:ribosomal protein S8